jgi:uncharacterized protein YndB with AHSA1/START domain
METHDKKFIAIEATINASAEQVWDLLTKPEHIVRWNNASDDWYTPRAENDLRTGGRFLSRMEARDGSSGFDFSGVYTEVKPPEKIGYTLDDGRRVQILLVSMANGTLVKETFEAEQIYPVDVQQNGWQSILNNFKKYVEASGKLKPMHFAIEINANVEKVFKLMLDNKSYSEWTSVFNPSSHYKGSWEKGSKIMFLGTDHDGSSGGMSSRIKENIRNRFLSIEHLGIIQNGKEIFSGPKVEEWEGALENYTFINNNGSTLLMIDLDVAPAYQTYFEEMWPKALLMLKSICEK